MIATTDVPKELAALEKMTAGQLRGKYRELFGEDSRSGNRQWLLRRCAWRMQALVEGDLSDRARRRAGHAPEPVCGGPSAASLFRLTPPRGAS